MGLFDSGIMVFLKKTDHEGRDLGETTMMLKESKKNGVSLVDTSSKGNPVIKYFDAERVTVFREADMANKSVVGRAAIGMVIAGPLGGVVGGISGTGKKDAWYMEIADKDGTEIVLRLRNEGDGRLMEKRIRKYMS